MREAVALFAAEDLERATRRSLSSLPPNITPPHRRVLVCRARAGMLRQGGSDSRAEQCLGRPYTADDLNRIRRVKELVHQHNFFFGDSSLNRPSIYGSVLVVICKALRAVTASAGLFNKVTLSPRHSTFSSFLYISILSVSNIDRNPCVGIRYS